MSNRKFRRGGHILSLDELVRQEFVYWNHKVTHNGWFLSWQLKMAAKEIGPNGKIYYAIKEEETMQKFYLREDNEAILSQKEYDKIPHINPVTSEIVLLGEFVDKSQARRYLHQVYLPRKAGINEN